MTATDENGTPRRRRLVVDTLSVDCTEFSGAFLTCPTCLCVYDADEHAPKLLSCTHTVCTHCAGRMAAASKARMPPPPVAEVVEGMDDFTVDNGAADHERTQNQEQASFKCPICRQRVMVPAEADGGVQALPPAFLVNQLLDLVCAPPTGQASNGGALTSKRTTVVVPTCAGGAGSDPGHTERELAYCSNCDHTYCPVCVETEEDEDVDDKEKVKLIPSNDLELEPIPHQQCRHPTAAVLPASVAAARWSDVLQYRAAELANKLERCVKAIHAELQTVDDSQRRCSEVVETIFGTRGVFATALENRKNELLSDAKQICLNRKSILERQLKEIQSEIMRISATGRSNIILDPDVTTVEDLLEYGSEVQTVRKTATEMGHKLAEITGTVLEPAANGHVRVCGLNSGEIEEAERVVRHTIQKLGIVRATKTCPSQCTFEYCNVDSGILPSSPTGGPLLVPKSVGTVLCQVLTKDSAGHKRNHGGDPVDIEWWPITDDSNSKGNRIKGGGRCSVNTDDGDYENNSENFNEDGVRVIDHGNGYYTVRALMQKTGRFRLRVKVLGRLVRPTTINGHHGCIDFRVVDTESPGQSVKSTYDEVNCSKLQQPAAVTAVCGEKLHAYVLDPVAGRVDELNLLGQLSEFKISNCDPLIFRGKSATGLAAVSCSLGTLLVVCNWRTGVVCRAIITPKISQKDVIPLEWYRIMGITVQEPVCITIANFNGNDGSMLLLLGDSRGCVHAYRISMKETTALHIYTIDNVSSTSDGGAVGGGTFIAVAESDLYVIPSAERRSLQKNIGDAQKINHHKLLVYDLITGEFKRIMCPVTPDDALTDSPLDADENGRQCSNKSFLITSQYCVIATCPGTPKGQNYLLACRKRKRRISSSSGAGCPYAIDIIDTFDGKVVNTVKCSLKRRPLALAGYWVASVPIKTLSKDDNDNKTLEEHESDCDNLDKMDSQSKFPIYYEYYALVADGTVVNRYRFR
ncbi:uncharacterized protein LOC126897168 isoform X2 [Daktulosphaira vitifoliae]|uniref:uncharacterized protein LOC126897168 isoform X2 n=1 Tax=Daktulosphaira vitifoliae TaxID=58002 RepID=UPI0021AA196F|nr:uncharacterized protein LOC126897168 isoform X2 [Daktulosphaira vitifoliae]